MRGGHRGSRRFRYDIDDPDCIRESVAPYRITEAHELRLSDYLPMADLALGLAAMELKSARPRRF